ncbi:hypothetical protein Tco_0209182 [Tanacetum coccineum]
MPSWTSSGSRVISGGVEYFCKCSRQLTVQTTKTRKNHGKRFVTCSKCKVYDFLDDDLPSEYYKELYGMFQNKKQSKKHMDYEQVINVLAMEKSMCEEELRATKSKLKLYDRLFFIMLGTLSVVCVGFGMLVVEALVQRLINEDKGRHDVLLNLAFQFKDSCAVRDDLRKAYGKCNDISQESRALI